MPRRQGRRAPEPSSVAFALCATGGGCGAPMAIDIAERLRGLSFDEKRSLGAASAGAADRTRRLPAVAAADRHAESWAEYRDTRDRLAARGDDLAGDNSVRYWRTILSDDFGEERVAMTVERAGRYYEIKFPPRWSYAAFARVLGVVAEAVIEESVPRLLRRLGANEAARPRRPDRGAIQSHDARARSHRDGLSRPRRRRPRRARSAAPVRRAADEQVVAGSAAASIASLRATDDAARPRRSRRNTRNCAATSTVRSNACKRRSARSSRSPNRCEPAAKASPSPPTICHSAPRTRRPA